MEQNVTVTEMRNIIRSVQGMPPRDGIDAILDEVSKLRESNRLLTFEAIVLFRAHLIQKTAPNPIIEIEEKIRILCTKPCR
jgi:hypothetical protein